MGVLNQIIDKLSGDCSCYRIIETIHGHFYYGKQPKARTSKLDTLTLPTRQRKEGVEVFVGDAVEIDREHMTITRVIERGSLLPKPKAANVDLALIVVAAASPTLEPEHLDRLLCCASYYVPQAPIICLSKTDLAPRPIELDLYEYELGYKVIDTTHELSDLTELIADKTVVVAGRSGVGKSTLLNRLSPSLNLKEGELSSKVEIGRHTTRHISMFELQFGDRTSRILDTPGFSRLNIEIPAHKLADRKLFPEIERSSGDCLYTDCLHLDEEGCTVKFNQQRKESYRILMNEAICWEESSSQNRKLKRQRQLTKTKGDRQIPVLETDYRRDSRRTEKQTLESSRLKEEAECEADDNSDEGFVT